MKEFLRKIKLIDSFKLQLPIEKSRFIENLKASVDEGDTGYFSGVKFSNPLVESQAMLSAGGKNSGGLIKGIKIDDLKSKHLISNNIVAGGIEELSNKISQQTINNITPLLLDLSVKPFPHSGIDAAFTIMAMHHVPNTDALLNNLTTAIKPGGSIHLIDLYTEDGNFHKNMEPVPHHGFNPEELADKLKQRGFTNCRHELAGTKQREHGNYPVFILSALKL